MKKRGPIEAHPREELAGANVYSPRLKKRGPIEALVLIATIL